MDFLIGVWLSSTTAFGAHRICSKVTSVPDLFLVLGSIYFADVISAMVHVVMDHKRIYDKNSTLDAIADMFQEHHIHPRQFIDNKPLYNPGGQLYVLSFLTTPLYFFTYMFDTYYGKRYKRLLVVMYTCIMFATFGQITHGIAHKRRHELPHFIIFLQKYHLIINSKDHHQHHATGKNYASLTGWSNPLINRLHKPIILPLLKMFPSVFVINNVKRIGE